MKKLLLLNNRKTIFYTRIHAIKAIEDLERNVGTHLENRETEKFQDYLNFHLR